MALVTHPGGARKQMNVRLPPDLIDQIDIRRAEKGLSRDLWVERVIRAAFRNLGTPTQETIRKK